jgi:hypothetical protein
VLYESLYLEFVLFAVSVDVVVALAVVGAIALFAFAVAVCSFVAVPLLDVRVLDKSGTYIVTLGPRAYILISIGIIFFLYIYIYIFPDICVAYIRVST